MDYRLLGRSGLKVPVLSFGTGTFGGADPNAFFARWGKTDVDEARRLIDICLDAGVTLFDTADVYADGASEEILGAALKGKRDRALIATKATLRSGGGPNDVGSSRIHLIRSVEASLKRLQTDRVDIYFMHAFDAMTPAEETLRALDDLISAGKIGYIGASNFSGWQMMKSLAKSDEYGLARYNAYQGYYSLIGRDYEHELMPLALDQGVGSMVWSPLGWGRLTGKIRRGQAPAEGRIAQGGAEGGPHVDEDHLFKVVDALDKVAADTGKTVSQIALAWLLTRPTVANVTVGARNEAQLRENLGAIGWTLATEHVSLLDDVSRRPPAYPYWHQMGFEERNPKPTRW